MNAIEELIGADELREQIIERAAEMVLGRWHPPASEDGEARNGFERDLACRVEEIFQAEVGARLGERVEAAINQALEAPFTPTNRYGERQPYAEPMTLRDVIAKRVEEQLKVPEVGSGRGFDRADTALGKFIDEVIKKRVHDELWKQFVEVGDAIVASASAQIKTDVDYLVKRHKR